MAAGKGSDGLRPHFALYQLAGSLGEPLRRLNGQFGVQGSREAAAAAFPERSMGDAAAAGGRLN